LFQNNENLHGEVKRYGCLFLSLSAIFEIESGVTLLAHDINSAWEFAKKDGAVKDNSIKDPSAIFRYYCNSKNLKKLSLTQIGTDKGFWVPLDQQKVDWKIVKLKTIFAPAYEHHVLKKNHVIYDSMAGKITGEQVRETYYRIDRR
jgi:hypothetical protein